MTNTPGLPTANQARGGLPHAYNFVGNKKPPCGGFFTVTLALRPALMTPATPDTSNEYEKS